MATGGVVDEIKSKLDVVEVVGRAVPLKRSGRTFKGLCPFHVEKTPSFYVFPESGVWKCFGCGAGGDIFSFVMRQQNVDFPEALRQLAAQAGVELREVRRDAEAEERHARLYAANEAAALFYHSLLTGPGGAAALDYLRHRGLNDATISRFLLGWAPESGSPLLAHLTARGFTLEELTSAGLVRVREDGEPRDLFFGRVLFPIRDEKGRTLGFGGRILRDAQPKYLNTPQTPVFEKGASLYGIAHAREAIRQANQAIIVEGYMDVLAAHQAGFTNVVAALGTAITPKHLHQLKRLTSRVVFALDPDAAGETAVLRGLGAAQDPALQEVRPAPDFRGWMRFERSTGLAFAVLTLPNGQDPDELILADPARWAELVDRAQPVIEFLLARLPHRHDLSSPQGKSAAVDELLPIVADIPHSTQRGIYLERLAQAVGLAPRYVEERYQQTLRGGVRPRGQPEAQASRPAADSQEEWCLALLTRVERPSVDLEAEDFSRPDCRELFRYAMDRWRSGQWPLASGSFQAGLNPLLQSCWDRIERLLEQITLENPADVEEELENIALELRKLRLRTEHQQIDSLIRDAEGNIDEQRRLGPLLSDLAAKIALIERKQASSPRAAPLVWRYRPGQGGSA